MGKKSLFSAEKKTYNLKITKKNAVKKHGFGEYSLITQFKLSKSFLKQITQTTVNKLSYQV